MSPDSATQAAGILTPILDRLRPLPNLGKTRWLESLSQVLLGLVTYLMIVSFTAVFPNAEGWPTLGLPVGILLIVAAAFMAIIVHELGHFFVGRWVGFRFRYIRIGPLQIDSLLKFSRFRNRQSPNLGATCFFPAEMKNEPRKFILMVIAGPAANIASAGVLLLPFEKPFVLIVFAGISLYLGIINLVPSRKDFASSDGLKILTVLFKRTKHERTLAFVQLSDEMRTGVKHEDLSADLINQAIAVRDDSFITVLAFSIAYVRAYYQKDNCTAASYLETCLESSGRATSKIRSALIGDAAIFQAERRGNIPLAEQWLADLPDLDETKAYRLQVQGAIFEARGDFNAALEKIAECEKQAQAIVDQKSKQQRLERLNRWKEDIQEKSLKEQFVSPDYTLEL